HASRRTPHASRLLASRPEYARNRFLQLREPRKSLQRFAESLIHWPRQRSRRDIKQRNPVGIAAAAFCEGFEQFGFDARDSAVRESRVLLGVVEVANGE